MEHPAVKEILTAEATFAEVQEYAVQLAMKKRLSAETVLLAVATLPVRVLERAVSASSRPEAARRIGRRDPDDVELLALALHLDLPIWSNDSDFEAAGVKWYTTAALLKMLGI